MTPPRVRHWEPAAVAAALLIGGALKYPSDYSSALVAAGLICLGVWLALEVQARRRDTNNDTKEDDHG